MKKAIYITVEGGDGSGKSSLVKNLFETLSKSHKVLLTAEFGAEHDKTCEELRTYALSSKKNLDEIAGQILFGAISKQHQEKVIKPNLDKYDIILSDRGPHSNYAYGPVHGIPAKTINKLFDIVYDGAIRPDITIFLNTPVEIASSRRSKRSPEKFKDGGVDRVEDKGLEFQRQVVKNFLKLAKKDSRFKVIYVREEHSPADILEMAMGLINQALKK